MHAARALSSERLRDIWRGGLSPRLESSCMTGDIPLCRLSFTMEERSDTGGFEMPTSTATTTEPNALAAADTAAVKPEPDKVEYPERQWIAQSVAHGDAVGQSTMALRHRFRDLEDALVAMELVVYYQHGDDTKWLRPDLLVAFGVGHGGSRSVFKVWEEGKSPDFVLEVASPSTAEKDAFHKAREYARIGVSEYWRLDPEGSIMGTPLEGYVVVGAGYERVEPVGGWFRSRVLGLDLRSERQGRGSVLLFRDPRTGEEFDGSVESAERRRRIAEGELRATKTELREVKERLRALQERFGSATDHPCSPERDL